jgi:hypothetical protein
MRPPSPFDVAKPEEGERHDGQPGDQVVLKADVADHQWAAEPSLSNGSGDD